MKIGAFIPIRLDSERLPGKAIKKAAGRPIVHHLLDRVVACRNIKSKSDVVVCTTAAAVDDPLVETVHQYGASVFRGDKDDLIKRFKDGADQYQFDIILQVDGDDPLAETDYMDLTIEALLADPELDAAVSTGLPFGVNVKSFTRRALDKVYAHYKSENNDTGFALYFIKSSICTCKNIAPVSEAHVYDKARLTLDYAEDLEVFRRIFDALYVPGQVFGLQELINFLKANPDTVNHNNGLQDSYMDRSRQKLDIEYTDENGHLQRIDL
jgi:spore coat polysaccharide biosynthesis protein SpsF